MSFLKRIIGKKAGGAGGGDWASGFQLDSDHWRGAWISVLNGDAKGKTYRLSERVITIGRGHSNFIQIADSHVSRTHCQIRPTPGGYEVVDMNSRVGTLVSNAKVQQARLEDKMEICLGTTRLRYEADVAHGVDHGLARKDVNRGTQLETDYVDTKEQAVAGTTLKERLLVLGKLTQFVGSGRPRTEILKIVAMTLLEQLAADRAVYLRATEGGWKMEAHYPRPDLDAQLQKILPNKALMSQGAKTGQPAHSTDPSGVGPKAAMAVPLFGEQHVIGLIYLDRLVPAAIPFEGADVSFVGQVAHLLGGLG